MTLYYCFSCQKEPLYLADVTDPDSPHFGKPCCPYCGSIHVHEHEPDDD